MSEGRMALVIPHPLNSPRAGAAHRAGLLHAAVMNGYAGGSQADQEQKNYSLTYSPIL